MASAEQPLKKRKLYESVPEHQIIHQRFISPLSQEEVIRKRRNRDEIRNLYDCYRRIRFCISQKDARLMPDFEQAYLSLITASRGCTSAQRIVAELIPRYASYCPTALEAAAKVAINMYNWGLALLVRGEDADGVAFQTAKACVFGLVDICCTASSEAPTSSVIRGICSAVFLNVLTFFISSFEGKDIYQICGREIAMVQNSQEFFTEMKQKLADEDEPELSKLFRFRALSLLWIFFCCPKNLLAACFELFITGATDGIYKGHYFLRQVTSHFDVDDVTRPLDNTSDDARSCTGQVQESIKGNGIGGEGLLSDDNHISEDTSLVSKNCLMGMVLSKDQSLRGWIFAKYNKLCKSVSSQAMLEISSALEGIFESFSELVKEAHSPEGSDEDKSDPSKYINRQYLMHRVPSQNEKSVEGSQRGSHGKVRDTSASDAFYEKRDSAEKVAVQSAKPSSSVVPLETDSRSVNKKSNQGSGGSGCRKGLETTEHGDSRCDRPVRKDLANSQFPSPVAKMPLEFMNDAFEGGNNLAHVEKNQVSNVDLGHSSMRSTGSASNVLASPKQHLVGRNPSSTSQIIWYCDGDPAAMDIYSASQQLWLGSVGPEASENLVRFQFEKFGHVEYFLLLPIKGFALVEYRNIMDAIRARECMQGSSPWGACLRIKFVDIGLGTRGAINGVAVGSSCHVYIGKVSSQWAKDEIMHEVMKVCLKTPPKVTDLASESALLVEFETAEEAATVMAHLRQHRKENGYHMLLNKSSTLNAVRDDIGISQMNGGRFVPNTIHVEFRNNNPGSLPTGMVGSPHIPAVLDSPIDVSKARMSKLSSLLSSLCTKYNIIQGSSSFDGQISRNHLVIATRDEDKLPTSTLWIGLPDANSSLLTDDEIKAVCNLAAGNVGSVVRLTRGNMQMGCCFVEFSCVDAAVIALKNLRGCPGMFFQIEFSQSGKHHNSPSLIRSNSSTLELISPRIKVENHVTSVQDAQPFQSSWSVSGCTDRLEVGTRKIDDGFESNMGGDLSQADGHAVPLASKQMWTYKKPETELQFSAPGSVPCPSTATQGLTIPPPPLAHSSLYMRPVYLGPNSSWDTNFTNQPLPLNQMPTGILPNNLLVNAAAAPFPPASVTPLAQISGSSMQQFDQMVSLPTAPQLSPPPPPPPDMPPPLPPSPPPLPLSQPPLVPPPPSSPPPLQPAVESSNSEKGLQYKWQGALCKSGVHYCNIYAHREDSDACKYSNLISEPAGWPARLDMTKRTDFRHVRSTFTSTPPHKREVCRLLPSTTGDQKGFQDFVSYLKQRECAGVIKIPTGKSLWARLLFILPYSLDTCSMLAISPNPSECLIALVLPKETNFEWV
ncbi:uncharacterized protein LOC122662720 [Telopea speciosissima]|uniref:uncharacterized protein LOC122662720 n=1 Tax=Telopea speciosissima TaxID=54955 RepID=UPI001CC6F758|nr:uncharacterized protein LOC122662720 [Telopea speciosissima]